MLLPAVATQAGFWSVAAGAGSVAVLAQLGLSELFKRSSDPVFARSPAYTAHSAVAFAFCVFVTIFGSLGWYLNPTGVALDTASARVLTLVPETRWLGAMAFGCIGAWDIPTCFAVKELRKPDFILHHFAMAAVALSRMSPKKSLAPGPLSMSERPTGGIFETCHRNR